MRWFRTFLILFMAILIYPVFTQTAPEANRPAIQKELKKPEEPVWPLLEIGLELGTGFPIFGQQLKSAKEQIIPTPDYYINFLYGANLNLFFIDNFGIVAIFNRGLARAVSFKASGGFSLYEFDSFNFGLVYRRAMTGIQKSFLIFSLGANYSTLALADQYKNLIQKAANKAGYYVIFYNDRATGFGGYGKVTFKQYFEKNLYFYFGVCMIYQDVKFPHGTKNLDKFSIDIPFGVGFGF